MTDAQLDVLIDDALPRRGGWRRSERGNLTRGSPAGARLAVFERPKGSGWFAWSLARGATVRYSPGGYATEAEAMTAVSAAERLDRERAAKAG
jgi:hypothetical protein